MNFDKNKDDTHTTLQALKEKVENFIQERDWAKFHSAKNVAINIALEAAELMEHFVWTPDSEIEADFAKKREKIEEELADIVFSTLLFANRHSIDISSILDKKLKKTAEKYPAEKVKGKRFKYNEY